MQLHVPNLTPQLLPGMHVHWFGSLPHSRRQHQHGHRAAASL